MFAILKKELATFFSSSIGYAIIAIYLIINGLFLWFFENNFNILHAGFADLNSYFFIAPWIFIFLIPAITMRSFSEEIGTGTIEILKTKPLSNFQIVSGKFLGALILVLLSLFPTLTYIYSVYQLGDPVGNIHIGTTIVSFIGLLFLSASYTSIGIFSSVLSKNQVISFITAVSLSFILFYGFEAISTYNMLGNFDYFVKKWGMYEHFTSIGKGVLDTRDFIYFTTITLFFLILTTYKLGNAKRISKKIITSLGISIFIVFISNYAYKRFDFTKDGRYTLSKTTKNILKNSTENIFIKVYLKGNFPAEFKRLQTETLQFLKELKAKNNHIQYKFITPKGKEKELIKNGLSPSRLQIMEDGNFSELLIFPWATVQYKNKIEKISLLKEVNTQSQNQQLEESIQNLEYAFTNALHKIILKKSKKIAILKGNEELDDMHLSGFLKTLKNYYYLAPFTLDSVQKNPQKTLKQLSNFDATIIAKPTKKFTEEEKYTLDQYICNGGKTLWLVDHIQTNMDSLAIKGETLAYPNNLNISDLLFSYGVRINYNLITDSQSSKIPLATGNVGNTPQYQFLNWKYSPLLTPLENHSINTNIEPIYTQFVNGIDLLNKKNNIKKTVLLQSSPFSKLQGMPTIISLKDIYKTPSKKDFTQKNIPIAVLLEGTFISAYNNRVKPFAIKNNINKSVESKMIVISDGDMIANAIKNGQPLDLGIDKWSGQKYGNSEFLLNAVNYLLNDTELVTIRAKKIKIRFLNKQRAYKEAFKWQTINIIFPLLIMIFFGIIYTFFRKRKYQ